MSKLPDLLEERGTLEIKSFENHLLEMREIHPEIPRSVVFESYVLQQISNLKYVGEKLTDGSNWEKSLKLEGLFGLKEK